jgi:excisionase family DNA binding protein
MKDFFSVLEVAKLLNVSRSGVLYHIKTGKLKATKVGKIYIISQENFGNFLKHHKEEKKKKGKRSSQTKLKFD